LRLVTCVVLILFTGLLSGRSVPTAMAADGRRITEFSLPNLDGTMFKLGDWIPKQKVIVLTFFTTWCVPCAREHPQLQKLYDTYRDRGLLIVAISADESGNTAKVKAHVQRYRLTFPVVLDTDSALTRQYDPDQTFPLTIVVGPGGRIAEIKSGYVSGDEVALEKDILALLEKPE